MSATTLNDLLADRTQSQYYTQLISGALANGVPVASWTDTTNLGQSTTQISAELYYQLRSVMRIVTASVFSGIQPEDLGLTSDQEFLFTKALTLFGKSQFGLDRTEPSFAVGKMVLTSVPTAPLYSISPGQITVGTLGDNGILFTNIDAGAITPGGSVTLTFQCKTTGADGNIPTNAALEAKTPLPGVSVTNPVYSGGTWLTQAAVEGEPNDLFRKRCLSRWATLGAEGNSDAFVHFGLQPPVGYTASPVTQIVCLSDFYQNGYWPNAITVVVGNDTGPLAAGDLAAVRQNYENPKKYGMAKFELVNLSIKTIVITADIYIYKSSGVSNVDADIAVKNSLADYQKLITIGLGVFPQKLGARIEDANKRIIRNVIITSPGAPITPLYYERIIIDIAGSTLTYYQV